MNTPTTTERNPMVLDLLDTAKDDLEQFRLELGHDQTNVHDRYEQLKDEIIEAVSQMKDMIRDNKALARQVTTALRMKLELLEEQVKAPQPYQHKDLMDQLTKVKKVMESIVHYLSKITTYDLSLSLIHDRVFRYKIKLGIIKLKLQLGTLQVKDSVMGAKYDLKKRIHHLHDVALDSEKGLEKRWNVFHSEISEAYEHLQKAFTSK